MRPTLWTSLVFLVLACLIVCQSATARDARPAQTPWEEVVKAAEKEGEVTVYATKRFVRSSPGSS
jgi:hypothetical protein